MPPNVLRFKGNSPDSPAASLQGHPLHRVNGKKDGRLGWAGGRGGRRQGGREGEGVAVEGSAGLLPFHQWLSIEVPMMIKFPLGAQKRPIRSERSTVTSHRISGWTYMSRLFRSLQVLRVVFLAVLPSSASFASLGSQRPCLTSPLHLPAHAWPQPARAPAAPGRLQSRLRAFLQDIAHTWCPQSSSLPLRHPSEL